MKRTAAAVLAIVAAVLVHGALVGSFLQGRRLLEPAAFAYGDYTIHLMDGLQVRGFLRTHHRFWGYSPWFFAGYPAGIFDAPSNRATGLMLALAGDADPVVAMKVYVALVLLAVPLLVGLAAIVSEGLLWGSVALVLAVLYFQQDRVIFVFCRYGMFHFLLCCALAVPAVLAFARCLDRPGVRSTALAAALLSVALFVHPAAPVLLAAPLGTVVLLRWRQLGRGALGAGAATLALAALASLPWALALWRNFAFAGADSGFWSSRGTSIERDLFLAFDHAGRNVLLLLALLGLARGRQAASSAPLVVGAITALAIRHLGSLVPVLDRLEPARFTIPAGFFAVVPALEGLRWLRARPKAAAAVALVALALVVYPAAINPNFSRVPNLLLWTMPLEERGEGAALHAALAAHTDASARVALEQDWAGSRLHGFIASYLRVRLDRPQMGGPHPFVKVRENGLNFFEGSLADRPFADWSDAGLRALLVRYNVGWLVARKASTIAAAMQRPTSVLVPLVVNDGFALFRVPVEASYFLAGSGELAADFNRIEVRGASPGGVVLKFHYHPALRASPPLALSAEPIPGDPDGFIRVENGPVGDFVLTTGG